MISFTGSGSIGLRVELLCRLKGICFIIKHTTVRVDQKRKANECGKARSFRV